MRSIARLTSVGLLTALVVATFVACKKEKEQNGPEIIVGSGTTVRAQDTIIIGQPRPIIIELSVKKGSGKDDADLKTYSCVVRRDGSTTGDGYSNRNAPNGTAFTIRDTFLFESLSPTTYEITYTVTDKNDKSASRSFRITFSQGGGQPAGVVDSLMNSSLSNQSDDKGTYIRYANNSISPQNRTQAENNPAQILFVYFYSTTTTKHSLISPAILRESNYDGTSVEWDNNNTQRTDFRNPASGTSFASANAQQITAAYQNGQDISDEFTGNGTQRVELLTGRTIAFRQGSISGLVYVHSATRNVPGATISIKIARP